MKRLIFQISRDRTWRISKIFIEVNDLLLKILSRLLEVSRYSFIISNPILTRLNYKLPLDNPHSTELNDAGRSNNRAILSFISQTLHSRLAK